MIENYETGKNWLVGFILIPLIPFLFGTIMLMIFISIPNCFSESEMTNQRLYAVLKSFNSIVLMFACYTMTISVLRNLRSYEIPNGMEDIKESLSSSILSLRVNSIILLFFVTILMGLKMGLQICSFESTTSYIIEVGCIIYSVIMIVHLFNIRNNYNLKSIGI